MSSLKEALSYFKSRAVYRNFFALVVKKYEQKGEFCGSISLQSFTEEEKEELQGFLGMPLSAKSITWKKIDLALKESIFAALDWKEFLEAYFGKPLQTRQEKREKAEKKKRDFFEEILEEWKESPAYPYFQSWRKEKKGMYTSLLQRYRENPNALEEDLQYFFQAVSALAKQEEEETLPIFASKITGNPHALDEGHFLERLLTSYLEARYQLELSEAESPSEYKSRLLLQAKLVKDELSNDVLLYGFQGKTLKGEPHKALAAFLDLEEPLKLSLYNLSRIQALEPSEGKIYIFENPALFFKCMEGYPQKSCLCGNGQLRRAVFQALSLCPADTTFYYAGDFDPEGLLIAQKLRDRFGERVKFWKYDSSLYEKTPSLVELSPSRLKKLSSVTAKELSPIKTAMLERKKVVYQEQILEDILDFS